MDILYPLRRIHGKIHDAKIRYNLRKQYRKLFQQQPNTIFLVMTPDYNNLGDYAILVAETTLFQAAQINYIPLTISKIKQLRWNNQLSILNGFPIAVQGGGNLGTLWFGTENLIREIVKHNPRSPIFLLPNTLYYESTDWGKEQFELSQKIYNAHKHLTMYAREKISFQIMSQVYQNVKLVPDMVMMLNKCSSETERNGCILCLRTDIERTRTEEQDLLIRQKATELFGIAISTTDMFVSENFSLSQQDKFLQAKLDQFSAAELVITDRLHGMIFCAITGTPCIVIDSKSPKLRGCYEWIKHLDYIRFVDDISQITSEYSNIPKKSHTYNNSPLLHYYDEMVKDIQSKLK